MVTWAQFPRWMHISDLCFNHLFPALIQFEYFQYILRMTKKNTLHFFYCSLQALLVKERKKLLVFSLHAAVLGGILVSVSVPYKFCRFWTGHCWGLRRDGGWAWLTCSYSSENKVSWRELGSNCCSAPSLAACTERHRLWGGSYLRLLRLILLEISINSHKAAPQGCQMPTAFSESGGATSILNFPTEIAMIYEFRRLINMVSWNNWIRIISVSCTQFILSDNHRRVQFWIGSFISRILITGKTWNKSDLILQPGLYDRLMTWLMTCQN